jgi:hypothetical protein
MISRFFGTIWYLLSAFWNTVAILVVLSVVATIPILQLASLGYMLECASRIARGLPAGQCFPGTRIAGKLVACLAWVGITWLPVWYLADMAYSSELISPGEPSARGLRIAARIVAVIWIAWVAWAIFRGGRWWHFLWTAPVLFLRTIFRGETWRNVEDQLWSFFDSLKLFHLVKLGFYGTLGALIWLVIPGVLMMISLSGDGNGPALGLIGLVGALWMWWTLLHLPFLQVQMARDNRFLSIFDLKGVRQQFRRSPWSFCIGTWILVAFALPLYLFRIESIPPQLWWALSLVFVVLMFPTRLLEGWALRRSMFRQSDAWWPSRWIAWMLQLSVLSIYVGFLYVGKFALWEGSASILLQHAFLPPVPFYLR